MKIRILLALLVPLALLLAAGAYTKRSRDAEALYQHHWRQEQVHLLAADGADQEVMFLNGQAITVVPGHAPGSVTSPGPLVDRTGKRNHHEQIAADHRRLKERYERIMHRPWTSGDR